MTPLVTPKNAATQTPNPEAAKDVVLSVDFWPLGRSAEMNSIKVAAMLIAGAGLLVGTLEKVVIKELGDSARPPVAPLIQSAQKTTDPVKK